MRVEVKYGGRSVETAALANSGYEAEVPELHLPLALARRLGIPLHALSRRELQGCWGFDSHLRAGGMPVRVVAEDRSSEWVKARAVTVPGEHEVLLSDKLLDALGIEIARAGLGYWRFGGEGLVHLRRSVEAQFWVE